LFAIFPVVFLFSENIAEVPFSEILTLLLIALGLTLLLFLAFGLLFRNNQKTGILVSLILILFSTYGRAFDGVEKWRIGSMVLGGRHGYLLSAWGLLFILGAYFTVKTRIRLRNLTKIMNVAAASLIAISLLNIGTYEFKEKFFWRGDVSVGNKELHAPEPGKTAGLRDIYYIILDEYAGFGTLKEVYGYDNREFAGYLVKKGFYIAYNSRSNYGMTFLSLASSLNMEYLDPVAGIVGVDSLDRRIPSDMIQNSKVSKFLRSKGYKFINFRSGWGATGRNAYADLDVECGKLDEFQKVLIQTTILRPLEQYFVENESRTRILRTFSKLAEVHKIKGPKFVFAHIVCPHGPFVFGVNGEPVSGTELAILSYMSVSEKPYLDQLIAISKKAEILVDDILAGSETPPIIIVQSDHGPDSTFTDHAGDWGEHPTGKNIRERFGILNAYYLPSGGKDLLYDSITPVNTFRAIFNRYFNMAEKLLPDRSFYSTYTRPYKFTDVSATPRLLSVPNR